MKQETMSFVNLNSTAIKEVTINGNQCTIVYSSSDKPYNFTINDTNFVENLQNTIKNGESIGKFVNLSKKEEKLTQIIAVS